MATTVLLVDDHRPFREALRALLGVDAQLQIVADAGDGVEAVRLAHELAPDVVIMDVSMPGRSGVEATRQIVADRPDCIVIALSMHADPRLQEAMLDAGARLYLVKGRDAAAIADSIHTLADENRERFSESPESGLAASDHRVPRPDGNS